VNRPSKLILNDDEKRIIMERMMKAIEITKRISERSENYYNKRIRNRPCKKHVGVGSFNYMPGPKSKTKDLAYHL